MIQTCYKESFDFITVSDDLGNYFLECEYIMYVLKLT